MCVLFHRVNTLTRLISKSIEMPAQKFLTF
ncbi:unnamed protein product [Strongylus vulgaris]|uniref:Uncharacterized protein n=1 Tax=Strongylus vulgaris TaxID=40348 RepID=A0A3P7LUX6_STRVU|nr:unnamed protein product [Strongylus vulgaris]